MLDKGLSNEWMLNGAFSLDILDYVSKIFLHRFSHQNQTKPLTTRPTFCTIRPVQRTLPARDYDNVHMLTDAVVTPQSFLNNNVAGSSSSNSSSGDRPEIKDCLI